MSNEVKIKRGDKVKVYPHTAPELSAVGLVQVISDNQQAIAVTFEEMPPFVKPFRDGVALSPWGVALVAMRPAVFTSWIELYNGGHYEIELET